MASKRAEPLTNGTLRSFSPCSFIPTGNFELVHFLRCDLPGVRAHDEMNFVRGAIDLLEQALQINRSTGAGGGDYEFHR